MGKLEEAKLRRENKQTKQYRRPQTGAYRGIKTALARFQGP